MKKNLTTIKNLTLGMVAVATLGLGSCVDDGVSDEMKAIYKNQATLIANKAAYKKAEADKKAAEVALQEALAEHQKLVNAAKKVEDAVAKAKADSDVVAHQATLEAQKMALATAEEAHQKELLRIAAEVKKKQFDADKTNADHMQTAVTDYLTAHGKVTTQEGVVRTKKTELAALEAGATIAGDKAAKNVLIENEKQSIATNKESLKKNEEKLAVLQAILKGGADADAKAKPGIKVLEQEKIKGDATQAQTGYKAKRAQIESAFKNLVHTSGLTTEHYTVVALATANVSAKEVAYETAKVTHTTKKEELVDIKKQLTDVLNSTADKTLASALTDQTNATSEFNAAAADWNPATDTADLAAKKADMDAKKTAWDADPTSAVKEKAYKDAKAEYDALKAKKDNYDAKLDAKNTADAVVTAVNSRNTKVDEILAAKVVEDKAKKDVEDAKADKTTVESSEYKKLFADIKAEGDKITAADNDILYYTTIDMLSANYAGADSDARTATLKTKIDDLKDAIVAGKDAIVVSEAKIKQYEAENVNFDSALANEIAVKKSEIKEEEAKLKVLKDLADKYKKLMEKYLA